MKQKTQLLFAKLFDSGGSNSHFKLLVQYFGASNIVLILENQAQLSYLENLTTERFKRVKIISWLPAHVQTRYKLTTNIKNIMLLAWAYVRVWLLSFRYGLAGVTISSVEPERYLYLFALPLVRVKYILHSLPGPAMSKFTTTVCNAFLGARKQIITVSNSMKKIIIENWQINESKSNYINVVYNALSNASQQSNQISAVSLRLTIVTLGHVDTRKNPSIWFEVAKALTNKYPSAQFEWFGNGPLLSHFQSLTANLPNICFHGHFDDTEQHLHIASIYYQPSIIEPQGIAVLEAMHNKLPCVVSNVGGLPESVINGHNGYVVSATEVDEHVSAISSLIENKDLRNQFGENSYARYNKLFTYASFKGKMDAIYKCA